MSPTNWSGLTSILMALGMFGGMLLFGGKILVHFVRLTDAVEQGGRTMARVETGMGSLLTKILDHDDRFAQTSERLDKLEEIVMTADQQAEGIVGHVMMIGKTRRRRGQS